MTITYLKIRITQWPLPISWNSKLQQMRKGERKMAESYYKSLQEKASHMDTRARARIHTHYKSVKRNQWNCHNKVCFKAIQLGKTSSVLSSLHRTLHHTHMHIQVQTHTSTNTEEEIGILNVVLLLSSQVTHHLVAIRLPVVSHNPHQQYTHLSSQPMLQ